MVKILKGIGKLDSFGVLGGHTLALIIFKGGSEVPSIFPAEVPRVRYSGFSVNNYSAPKRSKKGGSIIKIRI